MRRKIYNTNDDNFKKTNNQQQTKTNNQQQTTYNIEDPIFNAMANGISIRLDESAERAAETRNTRDIAVPENTSRTPRLRQ